MPPEKAHSSRVEYLKNIRRNDFSSPRKLEQKNLINATCVTNLNHVHTIEVHTQHTWPCWFLSLGSRLSFVIETRKDVLSLFRVTKFICWYSKSSGKWRDKGRMCRWWLKPRRQRLEIVRKHFSPSPAIKDIHKVNEPLSANTFVSGFKIRQKGESKMNHYAFQLRWNVCKFLQGDRFPREILKFLICIVQDAFKPLE